MKKHFFLCGILAVILMVSTNLNAGTASSELGVCLVDSLNGKERKLLAKWMFFAMAEHPEMNSYVKISVQTKEETDRFVGKLITRLLAEDCPQKTKIAVQAEGTSTAIRNAFTIVGQVASQEIMTDQNVAKSVSNFEKHIDNEKLRFINE